MSYEFDVIREMLSDIRYELKRVNENLEQIGEEDNEDDEKEDEQKETQGTEKKKTETMKIEKR